MGKYKIKQIGEENRIFPQSNQMNLMEKNIDEFIHDPAAKATGIDFKDHTDPEYIGPGTWNLIHRIAHKARNHKDQVDFIKLVNEICSGFPCLVCRNHALEYIKNHPLEEYLDILVDVRGEKISIGLFVWTWKFHNAVNARIKKPIMSWDTAYNMYLESESLICTSKCLNSEPITNTKLTKVPHIPEF